MKLFHQRPRPDFLDVAHVDQTERDDLVHHLLGHALDTLQRLVQPLRARLELRRGEDVDVPAGQPGREPHVLAPLADRQAELVVVHHHRRPAQLEAQGDFRDLGGLEGVADQDLARLVPAHDVDLLAAQLVHDVLDPAAAHADARAHRVHLAVDRAHGDFGPVARLAGQGLDLDRPLPHLRHLALEQPADQLGVAARQDDLDGAGGVANFHDQRLDPLAHLVLLAGDLLAPRHDPFDPAEVDDHRAAFEAGDGAGDDRADPVFVFLVDAAPLVLAEELDHHLLDRLRADPPHDGQRHGDALAGDGDLAVGAVELDGELAGVLGVELLAQAGGDGLLDVHVDLLALDVLITGDPVDDTHDFRVGHGLDSSGYSVLYSVVLSCPSNSSSYDSSYSANEKAASAAAHDFEEPLENQKTLTPRE